MIELTKKLTEFLDRLSEDWNKLAGSVKFFFLIGLVVLFSSWLIDIPEVQLLGVNSRFWPFILLCLTWFILPISYWFCEWLYFWRVRWFIAPVRKLGKDIRILNNGAALCVIDHKKKHIHWIENPRTLYDLGFLPIWNEYLERRSVQELLGEGFKLKQGIRTRRRPGLIREKDF